MVLLDTKPKLIHIAGTPEHVVSTFLRVFLANQRLTDKQIDVTTALIMRYSEYILSGVSEPYASILLFSTDTRKEVVTELGISPAHLNNTLKALMSKGIIHKDGSKYFMNPHLVPSDSLTFKFLITDEQPRKGTKGSSQEDGNTSGGSKEDSGESATPSTSSDKDESPK